MIFLARSMSNSFFSIVLLVLAGCSGQQTRPTESTTNTEDVATSTTAVTTPTEDASAVASDDAATASTEVDAGSAASAAPVPPAPVYVGLRSITFRPGARPPRGALGAHGRDVWSVVLAAVSGSDPALQTLFAQSQTLHLASSMGEARCSSPSAGSTIPDSVPHGDGAMFVLVNFRSERDARAFAAALTETPAWIGRVRVSCAD